MTLNLPNLKNFNVMHAVQSGAAALAAFMTYEAGQGAANPFPVSTEHTVALLCGGLLYVLGLFSGSANQPAPPVVK